MSNCENEGRLGFLGWITVGGLWFVTFLVALLAFGIELKKMPPPVSFVCAVGVFYGWRYVYLNFMKKKSADDE